MDLCWEDPPAGFRRARSLIEAARPDRGDLVLLPEMFDTGFSMNTPRTRDQGATLRWLLDTAETFAVTVQGGRTIFEPGSNRARNVMSVVSAAPPAPARLVAQYAKIHPFSLGGEHQNFEGGREIVTYDWSPLRVCPAICYDLRFPELFRAGLDRGAELFALGACWPKARQHHWRALLLARAIENQAFVLGVNRVGADPPGTNGALGQPLQYAGGSLAVSPTGEVLGELNDREGVLSVEIDPGAVTRWREKFPAWKDRRRDLQL
jgi:predicted amidohydrolase